MNLSKSCIVTRPAAPLPGQARQVGGVQTQFHHARLHARGHVTGARGICRDGQATDGRLTRSSVLSSASDLWRQRRFLRVSSPALVGGASRPRRAASCSLASRYPKTGADGIALAGPEPRDRSTRPGQGEATFIVALLVSTSMMSWFGEDLSRNNSVQPQINTDQHR